MTFKPLAAVTLAALAGAGLAASGPACAQTDTDASSSMQQQIKAMQAQIDALQAQLDALKRKQATADGGSGQQVASTSEQDTDDDDANVAAKDVAKADTSTSHTQDTGITLGGAVRFQYSYEDYDEGNERRIGDQDFDIFRLDLHGKVHGIILDAQWRWFQYMSAIQHAWVGYDFDDQQQLQIGLTRIPFGNQPYNSHNYFFSSNYYLGLEDTHAMGAEYVYDGKQWNVQLAFFKNDSTGGVDAAGNRTHTYSYNVLGVRAPGEGIYAAPSHPAGAVDTSAVRVARTFTPASDVSVEVGVSGLYGGLDDASSRIGHYYAAALHANVDVGPWNFQTQWSRYDYTTDSHATRLAVGAYAFYDTIAARADSYTLNVRYHLPVSWGPIQGLDFYNDYSLVTNKSGMLPSTFMNVLGVGVSAGDLYTYFDFVTARNQPFIGGSMAGDGEVEHRLNINFGFYF
ncbi:MAG TPA: porin [Oleiagrimonas sp.]|nr:porin [Oleiagrimonas sp.]